MLLRDEHDTEGIESRRILVLPMKMIVRGEGMRGGREVRGRPDNRALVFRLMMRLSVPPERLRASWLGPTSSRSTVDS